MREGRRWAKRLRNPSFSIDRLTPDIVTRIKTIIPAGLWLGLLLGLPSGSAAQNSNAPANVVTPAPAPREGTVGPEQLRDFALPGTRTPTAPPAEVPPAPARTPPAVERNAPAAAERNAPPARREVRAEADPPAQAGPVPPARTIAPVAGEDSSTLPPPSPAFSSPPSLPLTETPALPPIVVTQSGGEAPSLLPVWWPWLLVAALAGVGLALALRQRRRTAAVGHGGDSLDFVADEPPVADPRPAPAPAPPASPDLPAGLVTTRLRAPRVAPPVEPPRPPAPPTAGGVVSTRLRGWIEIDLVVREILLDEVEALLRVDLIVGNGGTGAARDITLEAVTTNAGESQRAELAAFFERPAAASVAVAELGPLSNTSLSHELRMPRSAIRAYEAQGRTLFVPVIAFNAVYRTASGEGRTSAAFLVGRDVPGSEKLAPLLLPPGPGRLLGLGNRRLEEAVRR